MVLLVVAMAGPAGAATVGPKSILVDFGPLGGLDGDSTLSQTVRSGQVWNNYGQIAGGVAHIGLQFLDGTNATGVTLRADGVSNRDGNTTLNAGWGTAQGVPQEVVNSWYFATGATMTFTMAGLNPNSVYDVEVFNVFNTGPNTTDIKLDGLFANGSAIAATPAFGDNWDRNVNGFTPRLGLEFGRVQTGVDGTFVLTIAGGNATIQALRVSLAIPEPATMGLLAVSMLGLGLRRPRMA